MTVAINSHYGNSATPTVFVYRSPDRSAAPVNQINDLFAAMDNDLLAPNGVTSRLYRSTTLHAPIEVDFSGMEAEMRRLARARGIDFERLLDDTSEAFQASHPGPRQSPLAQEDIRKLMDDDEQAIGNR